MSPVRCRGAGTFIGARPAHEHSTQCLVVDLVHRYFDEASWVSPQPARRVLRCAAMQRFRRLNVRLFAFVATLAMIASALAPAVTRVMSDPAVDPIALAQICTMDPAGMTSIVVGSGAALAVPTGNGSSHPDDDAPMQHASECPYCATHAYSFALPPATNPIAALPLASDAPPLHFLRSQRPLFAWIAASPRGPPLES